jgi:hypothetical protein
MVMDVIGRKDGTKLVNRFVMGVIWLRCLEFLLSKRKYKYPCEKIERGNREREIGKEQKRE